MASAIIGRLGKASRGREAVLLAVVFTIAYAATSDQYSNSYDQLRNLMVARGILQTGVPAYEGVAYWQHPPLFNYLIAGASLATGGDLYLAGEAVVLLFAGLAVFYFYKLAERVCGRETAAWATVLFGLLPLVWEHSDRVLHETMILFFFTAVPYYWYRYLDGRKRRHLAAAGILLGLGLLAKSTMLLLFPVIFLLSLTFAREKILSRGGFYRFAMPLAVSAVVAVVVFSPYLAYREANSAPSLAGYILPIFQGDYGWDPKMPPEWYVANVQDWLTVPMALLLVAGAYVSLGKKEDRNGMWLWLWVLAVLGLMSVSAHKEPRFLVPLLAPAVMLSAMGLEWIGEKARHEGIAFGIVAAYLAFASLSIVLNDGSWPGGLQVWKDIGALGTNTIITGAIPQGYMAAAYFGGVGSVAADMHPSDLNAAVWFNARYALYPDSYSPANMTRLKSYPGCNCSLYRIDESVFAGKPQFRVVDENGRPLPGAMVVSVAGSDYLGYSNSSGDVIIDSPLPEATLSVRKICYVPFDGYVAIADVKEIELARMPNCLLHRMELSRI